MTIEAHTSLITLIGNGIDFGDYVGIAAGAETWRPPVHSQS
jgi:hypothetical protein